MSNLLLSIDASSVDWARAQFALTAIYHWLFVPLTLGLAVVMGIMETIYYRTGKPFWRMAARFWQRLFGINFAMGVATGIILEFEFGTNWSNYSWFVGDIFGAPLAIEGIVAFFMESTFVAVMFFGWDKVSRGFHLASTWLTGLGATISAWWILVANSWMQYPVGCRFNAETMRNEMTSFADVALSPVAVNKFCHTVTSTWVLGAVFVVAVSCWYLLKRRHVELARQSIRVASVVGLVASVLVMATGHHSAALAGQTQPMKLAAMEALYHGGTDQGLTLVAAVNPFAQPDYQNEQEPALRIAVPYALSILATNDPHGYVAGVNDIINGYTTPDGTVHPSLAEKISRGRQAIAALGQYRQARAQGTPEASLGALKQQVADNFPYFGYGYIKSAEQIVPFIPVNFYAFRVMVGGGCLFIALFAGALFFLHRRQLEQLGWFHVAALCCLPLAYIVSEAGWLVAEFGRQPWTIQDMLPTWAGVSDIQTGSVALTFFIFLTLFTVMLAAEIGIMCKQIKRGPEEA